MELACRDTEFKNLCSQWMGLFCGMGTITTSHILAFVLKAQVGPGSLKQGLLKGQGLAEALAAHKVWLPTTQLAVRRTAWCCGYAGVQQRMAPHALLLASRYLCMELNPFQLDPAPLCNESRYCPELCGAGWWETPAVIGKSWQWQP